MDESVHAEVGFVFRALIRVPASSWIRFDEDSVGSHNCRMSVLLWALKVGPRGFAEGWKSGKTSLEVLKAAEDIMDFLLDEREFTRRLFDVMLLKLKSTCG